jgi:hypothetical protein
MAAIADPQGLEKVPSLDRAFFVNAFRPCMYERQYGLSQPRYPANDECSTTIDLAGITLVHICRATTAQ